MRVENRIINGYLNTIGNDPGVNEQMFEMNKVGWRAVTFVHREHGDFEVLMERIVLEAKDRA